MSFLITRQFTRRGEVQTRTTEVQGNVLRIGRGSTNDLPLEELGVSQYHAELVREDDGIYLLKNVANGGTIFLNGELVLQESFIRVGDTIRIHHYELSVTDAESTDSLAIMVREQPHESTEPSLRMMPIFQLSRGRWTQTSLSILFTVLVLVGSVGAFGFGQQKMFMPGPVSLKHEKFAGQCEKCHSQWKAVWNFVPDKTCQGCHPKTILAPSHFEARALSPVPQCASCHLEHKNELSLVDVADQHCEQCHGDLKVKDPSFPVVKAVHSFTGDHPEFAISRWSQDNTTFTRIRGTEKDKFKDDATLKLNHKCHLAPGLQIERQDQSPLECKDCHTVDQEGHYMEPISYERHCKRCHLLTFDPKLEKRTVTHGVPFSKIRQELNEIYADVYFRSLPETVQRSKGMRRLPGRPPTQQEKMFVNERVRRAEKLLFPPEGKTCLKCHAVNATVSGKKQLISLPLQQDDCGAEVKTEKQLNDLHKKNIDIFIKGRVPSSALFQIAKVNVPERWFPYSRFDHAAHFGLPLTLFQSIKSTSQSENVCVACHKDAPKSKDTKDVLLARISSCQECHREQGGAQARCKTCHKFHPKRDFHHMSERELTQPKHPQANYPSIKATNIKIN